MFQLRLTTKRELLLWSATIGDLRREVEEWKKRWQAEHDRANGAVNLLLVKKTGMAIDTEKPTHEDIENLQRGVFDIFGEATQEQAQKDKEALEALQS